MKDAGRKQEMLSFEDSAKASQVELVGEHRYAMGRCAEHALGTVLCGFMPMALTQISPNWLQCTSRRVRMQYQSCNGIVGLCHHIVIRFPDCGGHIVTRT